MQRQEPSLGAAAELQPDRTQGDWDSVPAEPVGAAAAAGSGVQTSPGQLAQVMLLLAVRAKALPPAGVADLCMSQGSANADGWDKLSAKLTRTHKSSRSHARQQSVGDLGCV